MLGVERQRDTQERSVIHGSSPSTPGRTTRAGGPDRRRASRPGAARGGRTRRERACGPAVPMSIRNTPSGVSPSSTTTTALAPSATSSPDRPTSRSRVSGSVAIDHRGEVRSRELERAVAELGGLEGLDRHAHGLLQRERAHLGRGAGRAAAEDDRARAVAEPGREFVGQVRLGEQALECAGGRSCRSIDLVDRRRRRLAPQHPAHSRQHDEGGRERHGRWPDLVSRSRVEDDVGQSGERVARPVRDRDDERRAVGPREPLDQADDLGALTRLAHRDEQPGAGEQVPAEVQQLGRVDVQGRHARGRERRHRRVARVVRAPHPGEDDASVRARPRPLARARGVGRRGRPPIAGSRRAGPRSPR